MKNKELEKKVMSTVKGISSFSVGMIGYYAAFELGINKEVSNTIVSMIASGSFLASSYGVFTIRNTYYDYKIKKDGLNMCKTYLEGINESNGIQKKKTIK